ncbi:MAG: hypothetical protein L3J05_09970, partial [Robiginitomaculum sp.]|nr:hypothetical protein [Robiginitomaculum sp.]
MKTFLYLFVLVGFASCSRTIVPGYNPTEIENNLIPAVEFENGSSKNMTVQDRMERYGVSAFSIALLDAGEIIWTKAYGTYSK